MCCVEGLLGAVVGTLCISGLTGVRCKHGSVRAPSGLLPRAGEAARFGCPAAGLGQREKSARAIRVPTPAVGVGLCVVRVMPE